MCRENGVYLFVITYKDDLTQLPQLIKNRAGSLELDVSHIDFTRKIDWNKVYEHQSKLEEVQKIAAERNGKCLSTKYINAKKKIIVKLPNPSKFPVTYPVPVKIEITLKKISLMLIPEIPLF